MPRAMPTRVRSSTRATGDRPAASRARRPPAETRAGDDAMKVPTHDAAPGAKSYGGMGERVLRAMGWSKCARPTTERDRRDRRPAAGRPTAEEKEAETDGARTTRARATGAMDWGKDDTDARRRSRW